MTPFSLSGNRCNSNFLADPAKLVKSCTPLPLPSPLAFSQTWKETAQRRTVSTRSSTCLLHRLDGGSFILSFLSHFRAASTKFFVNLSEMQIQTKILYHYV